ncbi:hypothetical protein [Amaricoccus macauensis]|uniref:hypothetical protein n=1 Tax=Amaricoccus macauensis TaxID=57001 RepID=UPI003C7C0B01
MDDYAGDVPAPESPILEHRAKPGMELRTDKGAFPILDLAHDDCLIEMNGPGHLRGYADIFEGDKLKARCLIVMTEPEGSYVRCGFKRRTDVRDTPPVDFPL